MLLKSAAEGGRPLASTLLQWAIDRGELGLFEAAVECWVDPSECSLYNKSASPERKRLEVSGKGGEM